MTVTRRVLCVAGDGVKPAVHIAAIVGVEREETAEWFTDPREQEFLKALSAFLSEEKERATLGKIGAVYDGRWIFWHRKK